jgi:hypothetical protein
MNKKPVLRKKVAEKMALFPSLKNDQNKQPPSGLILALSCHPDTKTLQL